MPKGERPVALSYITEARARRCPARVRIGAHIACASNLTVMEDFGRALVEECDEVLRAPTRLMTLPHLANSISLKFGRLQQETRVLLDGYVFEFVASGKIFRLMTVSQQKTPYQVFYSPSVRKQIQQELGKLRTVLEKRSLLSVSTLVATGEVTPRDVQILLGALIYEGVATTDDLVGKPLQSIRLPKCS